MIDEVAFFSECGTRAVNQDAVYVSAGKNRGIFVVADGMGGHAGGDVASSAVVNGIRNWWDRNALTGEAIEAVAEQCNGLLNNINREVFVYFNASGQMGGSTVAVLILWDEKYMILSAGDSRVYRARDKALEQLTTDDVWENLPEVKYEMSRERVRGDARFGRLTEAVGSDERLRISRRGGVLAGREVFLLCSDGVYKYCSHKEMEKIMCRKMVFKSADRRKEMLRKCAVKGGVEDNYSAVVCSVRL